MKLPPYLRFCDTEIANAARTATYIANGYADAAGHWWADPTLLPSILWRTRGIVENYTSPAVDNAPWYDPLVDESADFLGFVCDDLVGLDTTETRSSQAAGWYRGGGVLDPATLQERELVAHGYLAAASEAGVEYGRRWLADALGASPPCSDCQLIVRITAPPDDGTNDAQGMWLLYRVGLRKLDVKDTWKALNIREVTLTLVAGDPVLYRDPITCVDHQQLSPSAAGGACIPFDEWFCGAPIDVPICCNVSPRVIGNVAAIVTLSVEGEQFGGARLTMGDVCPGSPGVDSGVEANVGPMPDGSKLILDAARHIVTYVDPNGANWDGVPYLQLPAGKSVPWLEVAPHGEPVCVCVEPIAPCAGGGKTYVSIETRVWEK